jgi:hypothetical protein
MENADINLIRIYILYQRLLYDELSFVYDAYPAHISDWTLCIVWVIFLQCTS